MDLEIASNDTITKVMDHHGIVAGICRELKIAERVNRRIRSKDPRRIVQPGTAIVAMIINALGFTNRRLYLTPQFYQSKAMEFLFEEDIKAEDLDDHCLGKALDEASGYGVTKLFGEIAFEIILEHNLLDKFRHLDSTSFALHGEYNNEETQAIEVKHGYSKDHRPDLKQVMLSLVMNGSNNLPLWLEPQNGNSSDKASFHEVINKVEEFQNQLKLNQDFIWIADSALYTPDKLLKHNDLLWISRVPETIKDVVAILELKDDSFSWEKANDNYKCAEVWSSYGGIKQRFIIVSSNDAYKREKATFDKRLAKQEEELQKECKKLSNKSFNCEMDAKHGAEFLAKKYKFFNLTFQVKTIEKYEKPGKPKEDTIKTVKGYTIFTTINRNEELIEKFLRRKGRFIIATNNLNMEDLPSLLILTKYKEQQNLEGGFRFLKDPWFMVDSFYVKKTSRIEALMMIMALSLLIYNFAQHELRQQLAKQQETLPNQKNKPITNPTLKWIFQIMEGINIIILLDQNNKPKSATITNLDELRIKILKLFGSSVYQIYGIR